MRARLIVNPTASGVSDEQIERVVAVLAGACEVEVAATERQGHAGRAGGRRGGGRGGRHGRRRHRQRGRQRRPRRRLGRLPARRRLVFRPPPGLPATVPCARPRWWPRRSRPARCGPSAWAGWRAAGSRSPPASASMPRSMRLVDEERERDAPGAAGRATCACVAAAVRALRADGLSLPVRMRVEAAGRRLLRLLRGDRQPAPVHLLRPGAACGPRRWPASTPRSTSWPWASFAPATCGGWACTRSLAAPRDPPRPPRGLPARCQRALGDLHRAAAGAAGRRVPGPLLLARRALSA